MFWIRCGFSGVVEGVLGEGAVFVDKVGCCGKCAGVPVCVRVFWIGRGVSRSGWVCSGYGACVLERQRMFWSE